MLRTGVEGISVCEGRAVTVCLLERVAGWQWVWWEGSESRPTLYPEMFSLGMNHCYFFYLPVSIRKLKRALENPFRRSKLPIFVISEAGFHRPTDFPRDVSWKSLF